MWLCKAVIQSLTYNHYNQCFFLEFFSSLFCYSIWLVSGRWWFQFRKLRKSFWVLSSIHILFSITVSQHSVYIYIIKCIIFYNRCIYFLNYLHDINVGYVSNCDRTNIGLNDSAWKKFWELYIREVCTHTGF